MQKFHYEKMGILHILAPKIIREMSDHVKLRKKLPKSIVFCQTKACLMFLNL